jgi:hypothetical protein
MLEHLVTLATDRLRKEQRSDFRAAFERLRLREPHRFRNWKDLNFRTQLDCARDCGEIDEVIHWDLNRIWQIRNRFAHQFQRLTFDTDPQLAKWLAELRTPKDVASLLEHDYKREKLQWAAAVIADRFFKYLNDPHADRILDPDPSDLTPDYSVTGTTQ